MEGVAEAGWPFSEINFFFPVRKSTRILSTEAGAVQSCGGCEGAGPRLTPLLGAWQPRP